MLAAHIFKMVIGIKKGAFCYWQNCAGNLALLFALLAPIIMGMGGIALDLGLSYLAHQRLAGALDAAALAATAAEYEQDDIQQRVEDFMALNYPDEKVGDLDMDSITVTVEDDDVYVYAEASYDTTFMKWAGIDEIPIAASVTIHRAIKGLEAVLVLDNTGSMKDVNIGHLKTAAKKFVEILYDRAATPDDVKIGLVPYSSGVRVGFYGLGMVPDDAEWNSDGWDGGYIEYGSGSGSPFVKLPSGMDYTTNHDSATGWYGCVVEHNDSGYSSSATHVAGSYGQLWSTDGGNCTGAANCKGHGWNPDSSTNDPYDDDVTDNYAGPWDIYMAGNPAKACVSSHKECNKKGKNCKTVCDAYGNDYYWDVDSKPNQNCPYAYIQPLVSGADAETKLNAVLDTMDDHGATFSNIGMAWGMRLLSPAPPFSEGAGWEDPAWNKAIIIMTDGEMSPSGYSAYWDNAKTDVDDVSTLNTRLLEVCTYLKSKGVVVYTVNFKHATSDISESTKQVYKDCASEPWQDYYRFATTGEELTSMFEEIAAALSRLHISN